MDDTAPYTQKQKRQNRKNMQRMFRVVEYFDFSGVIPDCPVQVNEGFIISDYETHELFASFSFQNTSDKPIKYLDIRLFFYQNANVPYEKRPFRYSYEDMTFGVRKNGSRKKKGFFGKEEYPPTIEIGESFGRFAFIRVPESYFKKVELEISKITFDDGTSVSPKLVVKDKYTPISTLRDDELYAISRLNIYAAAEEVHPTKVVPQFSKSAWLCCCGHKNLGTSTKCELCQRDRDWQKQTFTEETISKKIDEMYKTNDHYRHDKTKYFESNALPETNEEIQHKIKEYEDAMKRLAEQEEKKKLRIKELPARIALYIIIALTAAGLIYLISVLLYQIIGDEVFHLPTELL